ncbi:mCG1042660, isoform CRA_a, partial [Mus musculus]
GGQSRLDNVIRGQYKALKVPSTLCLIVTRGKSKSYAMKKPDNALTGSSKWTSLPGVFFSPSVCLCLLLSRGASRSCDSRLYHQA